MNCPDTRRAFLKTGAAAVSSFLLSGLNCSAEKKSLRRPNIVFILADDVGCEVPGSYGGETYQTPSLDALARTGIRFTHCYSSPVCAPSRVKLLTGKYGFRNYIGWGKIKASEQTFAHILKQAGYQTAIAGKWQMVLQKDDPDHIRKMGFDESCVFGWHEGPRYHGPFIYENGKPRQEPDDQYGPDIFCKFITDFIERNQDSLFLAYYSMCPAHEISNDLPIPPPTGPDGRYQSYRELVDTMDTLIGRVVKTLEDLNLHEKTLILFTGDNGTPPAFITRYENGEYIKEPVHSIVKGELVIGGKGQLTDAGTHVPLIANWPGTTPAGWICSDLVDFSDFLPTFADLADMALPKDSTIDGVSFLPQIMGEKNDNPRTWSYCQHDGHAWVRNQRFKLYRDGRFYDLVQDPLEQSPIQPDTPESKKAAADLENVFTHLGRN